MILLVILWVIYLLVRGRVQGMDSEGHYQVINAEVTTSLFT